MNMKEFLTPTRLYWGMAVLSLLGLLDALYLTIEHYRGQSVICLTGAGCDVVLQSSYATIASVIPISLLGAAYYATILFLSIYLIMRQQEAFREILARLPVVGLLASFWLVYLQLFQIQAICFWCMVSAAISTLLFVLGLLLVFKEHKSVQ